MKRKTLLAAILAATVICGLFAGCNKKDSDANKQETSLSGTDKINETSISTNDSTVSHAEAIEAFLNATMKNDASLATNIDSHLNADDTVAQLRDLVAKDFIYSSGFKIPEPTTEELGKVNQIMDYIYGKASCNLTSQSTETIATYSAPNNLSEVIDTAIADAAASYDGDRSTALSDPEFFDLFLDAFIAHKTDLTITDGPTYTISDDDYVNGIYDVLYGMLGFYDLL